MKNKKLNNKKKLIIFIGILIIIIIVVLIIVLNNQNKEEKIKIVNYKEAEKLYQESNNKCTNIQDENDSLLLYLIFSGLDKDNKLSNSISYEEYNELGRKYNDLIVQKQELAEKCKELQKKEKELIRDKIFLQNSFKENTQIIASQYEQCLQRFYEQYEQ